MTAPTPSTRSIRCSQAHPHYLQLGDAPFIPNGLNLCFPRFAKSTEDGLATMHRYLEALSASGGNYARLFLGHGFFDIEQGKMGQFQQSQARTIASVLDKAESCGIYLKLTMEHFRHVRPQPQAEVFPGAANFSRPEYHVDNGGAFHDLDEYLTQPPSQSHYLKKLCWLSDALGDHPAIFGWELWNEMNSVPSPCWPAWTEAMLAELKQRFPDKLIMQSLGSFDRDAKLEPYQRIMPLADNAIAQAHRYLDFGAPWPICQGPVDVMMADAVSSLRRLAPGKPALLAEGGAVNPSHSGPWKLYDVDRDGVLLHDIIFAPFFAGAAGGGQSWHWHEYVDRHQLWWHFKRFSRCLEGIDPIRERFTPSRHDTRRLRVYALRGRHTSLVWCRDAEANWQTELAQGRAPGEVRGESIELPWLSGDQPTPCEASCYAPWADEWTAPSAAPPSGIVPLPAFTRSVVVKVTHAQAAAS